MSVYGYDPARVEMLHHRTREALAALATIRSDDPAAADAMRAVARTRDTLQQGWMPFIEAIRTSTAMRAWRHALDGDTSLITLAGGASPGSPVTTWIATNGLDDLPDVEVVDRLHATIDRLRAAVAGGGDVEQAERRLAAIADEAVRQSAPRSGGLRSGDGGASRRSWRHRHPRRDRCSGRFVGT